MYYLDSFVDQKSGPALTRLKSSFWQGYIPFWGLWGRIYSLANLGCWQNLVS